jgi:serine/threonine protein phosphatase PrpC
MVVADGMGGHHYGEIAAQIAAQTLADNFQRQARPDLADPFHFLHEGMLNAHSAILDFTLRHRLADSPRTTCVACIVQDSIAYWAHAGDSRLYLMRDGKVAAKTRDHSRIRILLDEGLISEAMAAVHPDRNKIYSCLGSPYPPEIEFSRKTPLEQGDVLLLCTDGLWGEIPCDEMAAGLRDGNVLQAVPQLLAEAEARGGPQGDNLSVVAVCWEDSYGSDNGSSVSTQALGPDEIATHMEEFGRDGDPRTDLSDDEIEQAIEEIRSTIEKFNPKRQGQ